jgi:hypothetical protein
VNTLDWLTVALPLTVVKSPSARRAGPLAVLAAVAEPDSASREPSERGATTDRGLPLAANSRRVVRPLPKLVIDAFVALAFRRPVSVELAGRLERRLNEGSTLPAAGSRQASPTGKAL